LRVSITEHKEYYCHSIPLRQLRVLDLAHLRHILFYLILSHVLWTQSRTTSDCIRVSHKSKSNKQYVQRNRKRIL